MNNDKNFFLYELDDEELDVILKLTHKELDEYIQALIFRFYSNVSIDTDEYKNLANAYKSSFILEKLYRVNSLVNINYTAIYTKTGLMREMSLDIYGIPPQKLVIN